MVNFRVEGVFGPVLRHEGLEGSQEEWSVVLCAHYGATHVAFDDQAFVTRNHLCGSFTKTDLGADREPAG